MAWSTPRTWVTNEVVTASIMNTHVRDQFNIFNAGSVGSVLVSDGTSPLFRRFGEGTGDASYTGNTTSFAKFNTASWGTGTNVTTTLTTGTWALVIGQAQFASSASSGLGGWISYSVSGATTQAASNTTIGRSSKFRINNTTNQIPLMFMHRAEGLTAGSNTFTMEASTTAATNITITRPSLLVLPLS